MEKVAPVVFPVNARRAISALLKLLLGSLLQRRLLLGTFLVSLVLLLRQTLLPGFLLQSGLIWLTLVPALPPVLDPLPGLVIALVMMIITPVLPQEPTAWSISAIFF